MRATQFLGIVTLILVGVMGAAVLVLTVCGVMPTSREDLHWRLAASRADYERYVQAWPNGRHAAEARTRIEDLLWRETIKADTLARYENYLKRYPQGGFAGEAYTRADTLAWRRADTAETIPSLEAYVKAYPQGRFVAQATTRLAALRSDERPFRAALQEGTEEALREFLAKFPGHVREAEAQQALKDIVDGAELVELLGANKIEVQASGSGIEEVRVRVRRRVAYPLTVRIPAGTYFVCADPSSQNMVATAEKRVRLVDDAWLTIEISAACANRSRSIPNQSDTFTVERSPQQAELARLMPYLEKQGVDYRARQAAVWIVTDNADYEDLGILSYGFGSSRVIGREEAARAMKICHDAGIDIRRKAVWNDAQQIFAGLSEGDVKQWLAEELSRRD